MDNHCPICLKTIEKDDKIVTSCNHAFCKNCLCQWTNQFIKLNKSASCPVCRNDISKDGPELHYWKGTKKLQMIINTDCIVGYYINSKMKYRIFFDKNNNIKKYEFYKSSGEFINCKLNNNSNDLINLTNKLITNANYTNNLIY